MISNMNKYGLYPLNYTIVYCSSSDPNFPIQNINKKNRAEFIPINSINNNNELSMQEEKLKNIYFNFQGNIYLLIYLYHYDYYHL